MLKMSFAAIPVMVVAFCCGPEDKSPGEKGKVAAPPTQNANADPAPTETRAVQDCPLWICDELDENNDLWYCEQFDCPSCDIQDITFVEIPDGTQTPATCDPCTNCLSSYRKTLPRPIRKILQAPDITDYLTNPARKGLRVLGRCYVEFPAAPGNGSPMIRARLLVLEANPKASQTQGIFKNSQYRVFGIGYEVIKNNAVNQPEFTITNFAKYVQAAGGQKCHYTVTLGGFRYKVFTGEHEEHP